MNSADASKFNYRACNVCFNWVYVNDGGPDTLYFKLQNDETIMMTIEPMTATPIPGGGAIEVGTDINLTKCSVNTVLLGI